MLDHTCYIIPVRTYMFALTWFGISPIYFDSKVSYFEQRWGEVHIFTLPPKKKEFHDDCSGWLKTQGACRWGFSSIIKGWLLNLKRTVSKIFVNPKSAGLPPLFDNILVSSPTQGPDLVLTSHPIRENLARFLLHTHDIWFLILAMVCSRCESDTDSAASYGFPWSNGIHQRLAEENHRGEGLGVVPHGDGRAHGQKRGNGLPALPDAGGRQGGRREGGECGEHRHRNALDRFVCVPAFWLLLQ